MVPYLAVMQDPWSLLGALSLVVLIGILKHGFASAKVDGGDATLVRPSNWNAEHKWDGGANDQVLTRDSVQPDGAKWDWPKIRETGGPTTLTPGAIADGSALKRSGAAVVGEPITQTGAANSLVKTDAAGRIRVGADPAAAMDAASKQYVDTRTIIVSLTPLGAAVPASGGATLARVDATSETFYVLQFADAGTREATWILPTKALSSVTVSWRSAATTGRARFGVEVREKGDGDAMGGGTVIAAVAIIDAAKATANQLNEATGTLSYTPGAGKKWMLIRLFRLPGDIDDTLNADLEVLGVQLA